MDNQQYIIKTFEPIAESSSSSIRVVPLSGQGVSTNLRVECSKSMRRKYDIGTLFKLRARVIYRQGTPILYSHYDEPYEIVTEIEAQYFIEKNFPKNA